MTFSSKGLLLLKVTMSEGYVFGKFWSILLFCLHGIKLFDGHLVHRCNKHWKEFCLEMLLISFQFEAHFGLRTGQWDFLLFTSEELLKRAQMIVIINDWLWTIEANTMLWLVFQRSRRNLSPGLSLWFKPISGQSCGLNKCIHCNFDQFQACFLSAFIVSEPACLMNPMMGHQLKIRTMWNERVLWSHWLQWTVGVSGKHVWIQDSQQLRIIKDWMDEVKRKKAEILRQFECNAMM